MATTPQPGDFGLTHVRGESGRLIRLGQWLNGDGFADYEHAFIVVNNDTVVEAEPGGARLAPLSEYDPTGVVFSSWNLTDGERARIVAAAMFKVGTPYSALDYFALAARRFHLPLPGLRRYVQSSGHEICSQLVDDVYRTAGVPLFTDGRWPGYVTPAALAQVLTGPYPRSGMWIEKG